MEEIRDVVWENVSSHRRRERESLLNKNRKIENADIPARASTEDVRSLANQLKKRKASPQQFSNMKELLFRDKENINAFLEVDGALEALVTALSGQNAKLQINAAYCLCNLSLGDKYLRIIKVAGPYLLMHLEGMNSYLVEACIWTIGNLSSHDEECVKLLKAQGALPSLSHLLNSEDRNIHIAAAYALSHLIYTGYDVLASSDFEQIAESVVAAYKTKHSSVAHIVSLISGNVNCQLRLLRAGVHVDAIEHLVSCLRDDVRQSTWHVRVVANLVSEESGEAAMKIIEHGRDEADSSDSSLSRALECAAASGHVFLLREFCWLVGNLVNHKNSRVSKAVSETNVVRVAAEALRFFLLSSQ